jgi:NADH-quinone oxidoreductase subunit H
MNGFHIWYTLITIVAVLAVLLGGALYLVLAERKVSAWVQDRLGPNRVGKYGLIQPIADAFKLLFKEDVIPGRVDKVLFLTAPAIAVTTSMLAFAVVPFGPTTVPPPPPSANATAAEKEQYQQAIKEYEGRYQFVIAPRVDIGIIFVFAVTSLSVYALLLSGWSSNNKFSFIGGLRSSAQLVSYEIPMGMSILGVLLMTGSLDMARIIQNQAESGWNIFFQPLAFLLFMISAFAECNRLPFDLPEAEQELVGGYHTEYSGLKFVFFYLGEYVHMVTTSFLFVIMFFGGWHFPLIATAGPGLVLIKFIVMMIKVSCFILFYLLIRWTIPRFRFDQLMGLAWKGLIPLALANIVCVMIVMQLRWTSWLLLPVSIALLFGAAAFTVWRGPSPRTAVRGL